ncbi:MAG: hypothetical protein CMF70_01010, partial [Magnetovibrio sp.]|nr:hypothetical protein [Magnetovibrio sp.]
TTNGVSLQGCWIWRRALHIGAANPAQQATRMIQDCLRAKKCGAGFAPHSFFIIRNSTPAAKGLSDTVSFA